MKKALFAFVLLFILNGCAGNTNSINNSAPVKFIQDSILTAKVKTALLQQRGFEAFDIHVNSYKGIVQLSGFIDSDVNKELAGQIARNVDGVQEVVNNLIVQK